MSVLIYEHGLLGGLLHSPDKIKLVKDWLHVSDFSDKFSREIYMAMLELSDTGKPIDLNFLSETMQPRMQGINVFAELAEFIRLTSMPIDVNYYGRHIVDLRKRNDFLLTLKMAQQQLEEKKPLSDIFDFCAKSIETLYQGVEIDTGRELTEIWAQYAHEKDDELMGKQKLKIITHYPALDKILQGFRAGNLITVAAGSGVGKTTFGLNILRNVAIRDKMPVMLLSLEMNDEEIGISTLAATSKTSQTVLRSDLDLDRNQSIAAVFDSLRAYGWIKFRVFSEKMEKFNIATRLIRSHLKSEPACKLVMVDYIGLMNLEPQQSNKNMVRAYELGFMSGALKNLARELGIVILMLAQTNRDDKTRPDGEPPQLSDLRDSSALGHDANAVIFIKPEGVSNNVKIYVAKNRGGPTGVATLGYKRDTATFYDLAENYYGENK